MNKTREARIIGICSPSGGGKTTLINKLSESIGNCRVIHFDDYGDPFWDIADFDDWIRRGADLNVIQAPELAADLKSLKSGESIVHPKTGETIEPGEIILFDTLVGRAHGETGSLIDYLIYIDVSLELALSRRLLRMITQYEQDLKEKLKDFLEAYAGQTGPRQIYGAIQKQTRDKADLLIDGERNPDAMISEILSRLFP